MKKIDPVLRPDLFVVVSVELLFPFLMQDKHVYDVPTAFFFALALALLQRQRFFAFSLLFPFICLNRETAILLTILFAVYFYRQIPWEQLTAHVGYQLFIYAAIQLVLHYAFAEAPGVTVLRPLENLQQHLEHPVQLAIFLLCLGALLALAIRKWSRAPRLMRTAFLTFAPVLMGIYLMFGVAFEYRVFVELFPVVMVVGTS